MPSNLSFAGSSGVDTMSFSATSVSGTVTINGVASTFGSAGVVTLTPGAGADNITVGAYKTTAATAVVVDLGLAGGQADGQADTVTFSGGGNLLGGPPVFAFDVFDLRSNGAGVDIHTFGGTTTVTGMDANDQLVFNLVSGNDVFDASFLNAALPAKLIANGHDGNDGLSGSVGADTLDGGNGDDGLTGGGGADLLLGGGGDDHIQIVSTQAGAVVANGGANTDTLEVLGSGAADSIVVSASSSHLLASAGTASIDATNMEALSIKGGDGADTIQVGDLRSAGVQAITIDLRGESSNSPDGATDTVNLAAAPTGGSVTVTNGADGHSVHVAYSLGGVVVETVDVINMDATDTVNVAHSFAAVTTSMMGDFLF